MSTRAQFELLQFLAIALPILATVITYIITKAMISSSIENHYNSLMESKLSAEREFAKNQARRDAITDFAGISQASLIDDSRAVNEQDRARKIEVLMQGHRELLDAKVHAARQQALNEGREEVRRSLWYERKYFQTSEKTGLFSKAHYLVFEERLMMDKFAITGWVIHKTKLKDKLDEEALDKFATGVTGLASVIGAALGSPAALTGAMGLPPVHAARKQTSLAEGSETIPLTNHTISDSIK